MPTELRLRVASTSSRLGVSRIPLATDAVFATDAVLAFAYLLMFQEHIDSTYKSYYHIPCIGVFRDVLRHLQICQAGWDCVVAGLPDSINHPIHVFSAGAAVVKGLMRIAAQSVMHPHHPPKFAHRQDDAYCSWCCFGAAECLFGSNTRRSTLPKYSHLTGPPDGRRRHTYIYIHTYIHTTYGS